MDNWFKSSRCNEGHCLEVSWRKSSRCDNNLCLEARAEGRQVQVRNNREPSDVLTFKATDWARFLDDLPVLSRS